MTARSASVTCSWVGEEGCSWPHCPRRPRPGPARSSERVDRGRDLGSRRQQSARGGDPATAISEARAEASSGPAGTAHLGDEGAEISADGADERRALPTRRALATSVDGDSADAPSTIMPATAVTPPRRGLLGGEQRAISIAEPGQE